MSAFEQIPNLGRAQLVKDMTADDLVRQLLADHPRDDYVAEALNRWWACSQWIEHTNNIEMINDG